MAAADSTFVGSLPTDAGKNAQSLPRYAAPREIGSFSVVGKNREYLGDRSELKYLCMPKEPDALSWDLNSGMPEAVWADAGKPRNLNRLLRWITENWQLLAPHQGSKRESLGVDFVCKRGLLSRLARTPYKTYDKWLFSATLFRGTIYLCEVTSESRAAWETENSEAVRQAEFWGHKFKKLMASAQPGMSPDMDAPLICFDQFYVVLKGRLESHSLLFTTEVDAIDSDVPHDPGSTAAYVKLRSTRYTNCMSQVLKFHRNKLLTYWSQCFLEGFPRVLIGFRTMDDEVRSIKSYSVEEMQDLGKYQWSGRACLSFLDKLLSFIKDCVTEDDPDVVYFFSYDIKKEKEVTCRRLSKPGKFKFLPASYLENFSK
ncbi:decapping and exoribonuclease protein-like isoform X2 [Ixodes scapularis]|uniref:decapping and exoribonuclease protein-like isoform X2 n=1 Tax=Ixodes scapularis TaxID=6945 RepID=UPI001161A8C3|nr:decapping and exoribonuclease protein-like isoform X2 [Ixodes scapularis]